MSKSQPIALITGSGKKRVGWHIAEALAERGYGLALHYHTSAAEANETLEHFRQRGTTAELYQGDLSNEVEVANLINAVCGHFGRLDVLVHCAAIWPRQALEDITADDVRNCFEVNTLSTFLAVQLAGLAMAKQTEGGCIVTLGDWAIARPYRNYAAYLVSKGAVPALTRCLAVELADRNPKVRVNCIHPGPVMLPDDLPEAERAKAIDATLVKREGSPRNIAAAVLYLIDNDFVTGTCMTVDGGRTIQGAD